MECHERSSEAAADPNDPAAEATARCPKSPDTLSAIWLPGIAQSIADALPRNFVATTFRILDRAASQQFSDVCTVQLSQPVPRWAFAEHWLDPTACRSLTLDQRRSLLCRVAESGDVTNLQVAIQAAGCTPGCGVLAKAASAGALECCKHLAGLARLQAWEWGNVLSSAGGGGHWPVCEWALAQGAERNWLIAAWAYRGGHPEIAELLKPAEEPTPEDRALVLAMAAASCDLAVLKAVCGWAGDLAATLDEDPGPSPFRKPLCCAVGSPTPDWEAKVAFLLAQGFTFDRHSPNHAFRLPPEAALQRLDWLKARTVSAPDCSPDQWDLGWAAAEKNVPAFKWLLAHGASRLSAFVRYDLGYRAPLEAVQLLVEAGHVEPEELVGNVLMAGSQRLDTLRWLVEAFGPEVLDGGTDDGSDEDSDNDGASSDEEGGWGFGTAAEFGCVEAMALLHSCGVTFGGMSWTHAAKSGSEAALEWLAEMDCPRPTTGRPYSVAAAQGDTRTLRVLRRLGLPWGEARGRRAIESAATEGMGVDTLRWMVDEGCPVDWADVRRAAGERLQRGDPAAGELLTWVKEASARRRVKVRKRGGK